MSVYTYPESSLLDRIVFRKTENGAVRAYLHTKADAAQPDMEKALGNLRRAGYDCIPYVNDGKAALEVRGFGAEPKLLAALKPFLAGKPAISLQTVDKPGWIDILKKRSLQASGFLYSIGDAAFIGYGIKGKSPLDVAAGVFYGLPTPVLMAYGRNDQSEYQIKDMAKQLARHMREGVAKLPDDCALNKIAADHKKGLIGSAEELLKRFPSEFMNLSYTAAGACILTAACKHMAHIKPSAETIEATLAFLKKTTPSATLKEATASAIKTKKLEEWFNAGVGSVTVASGLFGTLVKEKAHDPDDAPKSGLAGLWEWAQQKPLAITGMGFMISTLLHAAGTTVAMRGHDASHKTAVWMRAVFVGSALLAELMVSISSKGHGSGVVNDRSVDDSIIALAADLIAKQPKGMENALIGQVSHYLGSPNILALKDTEIAEQLRAQVDVMRSNPWAKCGAMPAVHAERLTAGGARG